MITEAEVEKMLEAFNSLEPSFAVYAVLATLTLILGRSAEREIGLMEECTYVEHDKRVKAPEVTEEK